MSFKLTAPYKPAGDQPQAIKQLVDGFNAGAQKQTLLGVTGSGKTFTAANVIQQLNKPALVIAHNKTLAAQLTQEYRAFFRENSTNYFVSYYDYYQPEAYMPITDTYIEKDASINQEIGRLRHATTQALLTRKDVIVVASVSCIYGLGSPEEYLEEHKKISVGDTYSRFELLQLLISIHFERTNADLKPGTFRAIGSQIEIMLASEEEIIMLDLEGNNIARIRRVDPISRSVVAEPETFFLFPAKHFVLPEEEKQRAMRAIREELAEQLRIFEMEGKVLEAERLRRRTTYDLAMIEEIGYCSGIENYSRHLEGRAQGTAPSTLISYFPHMADGTPDFITIIDESHVTVSQIRGMYAGDQARKQTLIEHGFRLPSAKDNRPLMFNEFEKRVGQTLYVSATPGEFEYEESSLVAEQIIRPTGLIDPEIEIRPVVQAGKFPGQVPDMIAEVQAVTKRGARTLVTVLTKKMAEDLSEFLKEKQVRAEYIHSDILTIERIKILTSFRKGEFDCLVGVNLLREGLDLPEVELVAILDADKEGFLRSETSLIQTMGRAARNVNGHVLLYADKETGSMKAAISETGRRRVKQLEYNKKHGITPVSITKAIGDITDLIRSEQESAAKMLAGIETKNIIGKPKEIKRLIKEKEVAMTEAVKVLDFETAAIVRDEINELNDILEK
ncbi:MAG: excinuclease ABC subunit UvrB [bacterium]|nr:excinuclease ABC subunit UvrB [bacterium]